MADAVSMYTNINKAVGISYIREFLTTNTNKISTNFPQELFLQTLECVMTHNVFSFADTCWLQLTGTAMGTPSACAYATLTFGHFKNSVILQNFKHELLYYKRYIDDVIGIWLPPAVNALPSWDNFICTLENRRTIIIHNVLRLRTELTLKHIKKYESLSLHTAIFGAPSKLFQGPHRRRTSSILVTEQSQKLPGDSLPLHYQTTSSRPHAYKHHPDPYGRSKTY